MSDPNESPSENAELARRIQANLVEAHIALIKMQQRLLDSANYAGLFDEEAMRDAWAVRKEALSAGRRPSLRTAEILAAGTLEEASGSSSSGNADAQNFRRNIVFYGLLAVLLGVLLAITLNPNSSEKDSRRLQSSLSVSRADFDQKLADKVAALRDMQLEVTNDQKALEQTQGALIRTQEALRRAEEALARERGHPAAVPFAFGNEVTPPAVLSPKETLSAAQKGLKTIEISLNENIRVLEANQREFLRTAKALAEARSGLDQVDLEIRRTRGLISTDDLLRLRKPVESYLLPEAREISEALAVAGESVTEGEQSIPDNLADVQALAVKFEEKLNGVQSEISAEETQITKAQAQLIQTQRQLADAKQELLDVQQAEARKAQETSPPGNSN